MGVHSSFGRFARAWDLSTMLIYKGVNPIEVINTCTTFNNQYNDILNQAESMPHKNAGLKSFRVSLFKDLDRIAHKESGKVMEDYTLGDTLELLASHARDALNKHVGNVHLRTLDEGLQELKGAYNALDSDTQYFIERELRRGDGVSNPGCPLDMASPFVEREILEAEKASNFLKKRKKKAQGTVVADQPKGRPN